MSDPPADDEPADEPVQVALGFESERNRELLAGLLDGYEVVTAHETVPEGTGVCVVDSGGFAWLREALAEWKRAEQPAAAPVLLVDGDEEETLWSRYADAMGEALDTVQPVPAPKRAIRARVDGLAALRRHSMRAARRDEQLALYGRAMDDAQVGITIADATDPDLPLVYVNERFCQMTGYNREEALGCNCRFLQGPATEERKRQQFREAFAAERPVTVELRNYRKSGELFWNEVQVVPVRDDDGEVTHYIGFQQDVTERKHRETQLEEYEQIVQSVGDPILVVDGKGVVAYTNEAAKQAFSGGAAGDEFAALFADPGATAIRDALAAVHETGDEQTCELSVPGPVGGPATYQLRFQPETPEDDRIIVVARDITDIRRHQDRLSVLDRVLRHDLRNKLNVIAGHASRLVDDPDQPPAAIAQTADTIVGATDSLLDIAEAVRTFDVSPDDVSGIERDVAELVREMVPELRAAHPDLGLTTNLPEQAVARCPAQLQFCLEELIDSAVKRADDTPEVTLSVTADEASVTLRIYDEGAPLPPVERRALTAGAETQLEHTQGVGIWLVRWAVEGVGGSFQVEDTDAGTTVALTLPT
ncbi:PAS domain-containing protein [Halosegnis sp.]|uniref:PAS domain-containing protein n=1 Tax=Halosegnis sp. TaxID=2864959 RepID=UPI0035D4BE17